MRMNCQIDEQVGFSLPVEYQKMLRMDLNITDDSTFDKNSRLLNKNVRLVD